MWERERREKDGGANERGVKEGDRKRGRRYKERGEGHKREGGGYKEGR